MMYANLAYGTICAQIFCCAQRLGKTSYKKKKQAHKAQQKASYCTQQCNTRASLSLRSSTQEFLLLTLIRKSSLSFPFGLLAHVLLLLICGNLFASREKVKYWQGCQIIAWPGSFVWFDFSDCGTSYGLWFNYEFGLFGG